MSDHFVTFDSATILVADDDPILREFAAVHLATPTVEVEVAEDGVAALERLKKGGIDIALVDLDMPRMDGFELIAHIRANSALKHLPIVVVTGREDMIAVDKAYAAGATSFVIKPLNWRVLSHQLAYVLRTNRSENAVRDAYKTAIATIQVKDQVLRLAADEPLGLLATVQEAVASINQCSDEPTVRYNTIQISEAVQSFQSRHQKLFTAVASLPDANPNLFQS